MGWSVHLREEAGSSLSQIEKWFVVARLNAPVAVCWKRDNLNFQVDTDYDDLLQMLEVLGVAAPCGAIHVYKAHQRTYLAN